MTVFRPTTFFAVAAVLFVLAFQLWISPNNPPGFHHDEAAFALNGYTIAHGLRDQDGALLPIVFPSFKDYKSAAFSYAVAPAILLFGPHDWVVRAVATAFGLVAVLLVGLIGYRRAGPGIGLAAGCLAGLTPWLFQLGRVAYDTSMFPLATALILLAVEWWSASPRSPARVILMSSALAAMTYAYPAGRLLGPLLAAALLVFVRRVSWRSLAAVWAGYGILLIPLLAYRVRHPQGLTARYHQTTFVTSDMSWAQVVRRAASNYLHDLNPWHWLVSGDRKPYVDVWGAPQLLATMLVLAAVGAGVIVLRRRDDRWWLYVGAAYLLSAAPAAFTVDRHDALRLSAMPASVGVLAIAGMEAVRDLKRPLLHLAAAALAVAALVEWGFFVNTYATKGHDSRLSVFETGVPALLQRGFAGGHTVYVDYDDAYARTVAGWYAVSHGLPQSRVSRLPDGGIPPAGSMVFGRTQSCDYVCDELAAADSFWLARAVGPRPSR